MEHWIVTLLIFNSFIYVPQEGHLIGSNVATVLCLHKRITSSPKPILYAISKPHALSIRFPRFDMSLVSYYSTTVGLARKSFVFNQRNAWFFTDFLHLFDRSLHHLHRLLTGRAITLSITNGLRYLRQPDLPCDLQNHLKSLRRWFYSGKIVIWRPKLSCRNIINLFCPLGLIDSSVSISSIFQESLVPGLLSLTASKHRSSITWSDTLPWAMIGVPLTLIGQPLRPQLSWSSK